MISKKDLQCYLPLFNNSKTKEEAKISLMNSGIIDSDGRLNENYYK